MGNFLNSALSTAEWIILGYFIVVNTFYLVLYVSAARELLRHSRSVRGESRWKVLSSGVAPKISILAPAYNEAATIGESLPALLSLYYPNLEVIVINDGSKDDTLEVIRAQFNLTRIHPIYARRIETKGVVGLYRSSVYPNLVVIDKKNGGKADALNVGLNFASGDLVCAIDSDTLIEPDAIQRMVRPFLESSAIIAAGGTIRVVNDSVVKNGRVMEAVIPKSLVAGVQTVEYLRAFLFGRLGWNQLGGNLIISGAFGLFRRDAVVAAGGYLHDTVGEDIELVVRMRRVAIEQGLPSHVAFVPDPVAWTEVPETLRVLGRQRDRWHRGLMDSLWRHRKMFLNPRYGSVGLVAFPYFFFVELLAPVIEAIGIIGLIVGLIVGAVNWPFAILFFLVAYGLGIIFSVLTVALDEIGFSRTRSASQRLHLIGWAFIENLGYRQLSVIWRLRGIVSYLRGSREWGRMERKGFASTPPATLAESIKP